MQRQDHAIDEGAGGLDDWFNGHLHKTVIGLDAPPGFTRRAAAHPRKEESQQWLVWPGKSVRNGAALGASGLPTSVGLDHLEEAYFSGIELQQRHGLRACEFGICGDVARQARECLRGGQGLAEFFRFRGISPANGIR